MTKEKPRDGRKTPEERPMKVTPDSSPEALKREEEKNILAVGISAGHITDGPVTDRVADTLGRKVERKNQRQGP